MAHPRWQATTKAQVCFLSLEFMTPTRESCNQLLQLHIQCQLCCISLLSLFYKKQMEILHYTHARQNTYTEYCLNVFPSGEHGLIKAH